MRTLLAIAAASVIATAAAAPVQAREGCGPGMHRMGNGMCRPNRGTEARWMEGHYYSGRGYYYHNQWYQHRHRQNGVWVYL